jgi:hypothetical protein
MIERFARVGQRVRSVTLLDVLVRLPALAFALVLYVVPLLVAPIRSATTIGLAGLVLTLVGMVTLWRWPVTAAACLFLTGYATTLWLADAPVSVVAATSVGLALLFLLQSAELARATRGASVGAGVVRSQALRGMAFGAATLVTALLVTTGAGALAGAVPFATAPFLAAAGALGVVLALAAAVTHATR